MGPIGYPETSATIYQPRPHNIPKQRSRQHSGKPSLKLPLKNVTTWRHLLFAAFRGNRHIDVNVAGHTTVATDIIMPWMWSVLTVGDSRATTWRRRWMSKVAVTMLGNTVARINAIIRIASKFNSDVRRPKASQESTNCHQLKQHRHS